jgi:two-component system chemotaxis response regulator CheB
VRAQGLQGYLSFTCRIGHAFSTTELLLAKELAVEKHLWDGVCALEELSALLEDLAMRPDDRGLETLRGRLQERQATARKQAQALRQFTEETRPVQLDGGGVTADEAEPGR